MISKLQRGGGEEANAPLIIFDQKVYHLLQLLELRFIDKSSFLIAKQVRSDVDIWA